MNTSNSFILTRCGVLCVLCVLCVLYYICSIPKLQNPQPNTNKLYAELIQKVHTLQTGDVIFVRKRLPQDIPDFLLTNYFHGHGIMCVRLHNTVYGLDFVNENNDIPTDTQNIMYINSHKCIRLFRLETYIRETTYIYNSEITFYCDKHKLNEDELQQRNHRLICFLHYINNLKLQYASFSQQTTCFMYEQLCIPYLTLTQMNCVQYISLAYSFLNNKPIHSALYGIQLHYILEQDMYKVVF